MKLAMYNSGPTSQRNSKGLALIELMIAMVLGLVLVGAAAGVMLSNTQSFRSTKDLSQTQDSVRLGFELMARDIRQAGSIACGNDIDVENLLIVPPWYLDWNNASKGQLFGDRAKSDTPELTNRVAGTEALTIFYAENTGLSVASLASDVYKFNNKNGTIRADNEDIVFLCNTTKAAIFKATAAKDEDATLTVTEGSSSLSAIPFKKNSAISKLKSRTWYLGTNEQDGTSLYLAELSGTTLGEPIEIASGVNSLNLSYRLTDTATFKTASSVGSQWPLVNAVQITLTLDLYKDAGDATPQLSSIVALRNRIL